MVIIPKKIAAKSSPSLTNENSYIVDDYDDLFCMLATVVKQEGLDRTVMLMTNDKLRDHSREMRDPDVSDLRAHVLYTHAISFFSAVIFSLFIYGIGNMCVNGT